MVAIRTAEGSTRPSCCGSRPASSAAASIRSAAPIVEAAAERKIELAPVRGFDSPAGKGAIGMVERRRVVLGNARFLDELDIATQSLEAEAERFRREGATAIFVAIDGKAAGVIAIADPVKDTAAEALAALKADGIARSSC